MGKLYDQPTNVMATKNLPTTEQLRIAQLCDDKKDQSETKEKCRNIVEMTKCVESVALTALHDCNGDLQQAIGKIMDGGLKDTEWITTSKKVKKSRDNWSSSNANNTTQSGTGNEVGSTNHNDGGGGSHRQQQPGSWNQQDGRRRPRRDRDRSDRGDRDRRQHQPQNQHRPPGHHYQQHDQNGPPSSTDNQQQMDHWNNSMAHQTGGVGGGDATDLVPVGQWNPNQPDDRQPAPVSSWGAGQNQNQPQQQDARRRPRREPDRDRRQYHPARGQNQQQQQQNGSRSDGGSQQQRQHVEEWNHVDDWGEEEDWQNIKNRVFTNVKVGQQQQQQPPATPQQQAHQSTLPTSGGGGGRGPPSSTSSATLQTVSSGSKTVASHHQTNASPSADFATGTAENAAQLHGESIDVNILFGQQQGQKVGAKPDDAKSAGGSWSKQATATLKSELGIGQQNVPTATTTFGHQAAPNSHLARPPRQYTMTPKTMSKVEMPNSEASIGQLDVVFGEFSNSSALKMRQDAGGASQQNYFGDLGYDSAEHGKMKDQNQQQQQALVYQSQQQRTTPMKDHHHHVTTVTSQTASTIATSNTGVLMDNGTGAPERGVPPPGYGPHQRPTSDAYQQPAQAAPLTLKPQQQGMTGMSNQQQQQQQQRVFIPSSNISSSNIVDTSNVMSQMQRADGNIGPSVISLAATQTYGNLGYSTTMPSRSQAVTTTGKAQMNTAIYNPAAAANAASYQALAAAAMPYIFPTDQSYLNALQYLSPAAAAGYPFGALGTLPFDLSNTLNLRDAQTTMGNVSADGKTFGRADSGLLSGLGVGAAGLGAPPGLAGGAQQGTGPQQAQVPDAQQQAAAAAQLLSQAFHHPAAYPLMQAPAGPFYTPFVMPTTNPSSSSAPTMAQYNKTANGMFAATQPIFYGNQELQLAQDYSKSMYSGMGLQTATALSVGQQQQQQNKQQSANANMVSSAAGQDMGQAKSYNPAMKMFENKVYQQSAATPPPGMGVGGAGGGGYASAGATQPFHGAYAPPQFMAAAAHLLPPSMVAQQQQQSQQQAQQNSNDGQRGQNAGGGKAGVNIYANKSAGAYWNSSN